MIGTSTLAGGKDIIRLVEAPEVGRKRCTEDVAGGMVLSASAGVVRLNFIGSTVAGQKGWGEHVQEGIVFPKSRWVVYLP